MEQPLEIIGLNRQDVRIVWDEGDEDLWTARELRAACVCANCQSEVTGARLLDNTKIPADLTVTDIHFVGNYGLGMHFSDGHTTGIYRLRQLKRAKP